MSKNDNDEELDLDSWKTKDYGGPIISKGADALSKFMTDEIINRFTNKKKASEIKVEVKREQGDGGIKIISIDGVDVKKKESKEDDIKNKFMKSPFVVKTVVNMIEMPEIKDIMNKDKINIEETDILIKFLNKVIDNSHIVHTENFEGPQLLLTRDSLMTLFNENKEFIG
jgi:hypothetical protein